MKLVRESVQSAYYLIRVLDGAIPGFKYKIRMLEICVDLVLDLHRISSQLHLFFSVFSYRQPSKAQWLLYVPPGLTFTNSTFCPHSVFMCFVWISEQTAIISLCSINWLVFITETECLLRGTDGMFVYNSS
jgi:hypothetical protein